MGVVSQFHPGLFSLMGNRSIVYLANGIYMTHKGLLFEKALVAKDTGKKAHRRDCLSEESFHHWK
jgi:hypothetical protein